MSAVVIAAPALREWAQRILEAIHTPASAAALIAETLVAANLRGVDSHGVQLLLFYVEKIEQGRVDVSATGRVVSESGACLLYDGENGLGQVVSSICVGHAVRLARAHGIGMATARESNHFGAAAWWADRIASEGMIGIVTCNASPMVAPWQGREPRFGTNPLCVAVPREEGRGWLLDMATTTVAMGRVYGASVRGEKEIPPGWALDTEGVPTTSTETALAGLLMPLGGYKGSGLAMLAEMLSGVLSGGAMSTELGGLRVQTRPFRVSQTFVAIDVARFMPLDEFRARVARLVEMVKSSHPARGYGEVMVAGDPEWRSEAARAASGIPVAAGLHERLVEISARLGVAIPG